MAHSQVSSTTKKKNHHNFSLKVPQPFSLEKTTHISIYLRNWEKLIVFFQFSKKIFSIKNWSLWWGIQKAPMHSTKEKRNLLMLVREKCETCLCWCQRKTRPVNTSTKREKTNLCLYQAGHSFLRYQHRQVCLFSNADIDRYLIFSVLV